MEKETKESIIMEIHDLLEFDQESRPIYLAVLDILDDDELIDVRNRMVENKQFLNEHTKNWLDEIYEKTKKD